MIRAVRQKRAIFNNQQRGYAARWWITPTPPAPRLLPHLVLVHDGVSALRVAVVADGAEERPGADVSRPADGVGRHRRALEATAVVLEVGGVQGGALVVHDVPAGGGKAAVQESSPGRASNENEPHASTLAAGLSGFKF